MRRPASDTGGSPEQWLGIIPISRLDSWIARLEHQRYHVEVLILIMKMKLMRRDLRVLGGDEIYSDVGCIWSPTVRVYVVRYRRCIVKRVEMYEYITEMVSTCSCKPTSWIGNTLGDWRIRRLARDSCIYTFSPQAVLLLWKDRSLYLLLQNTYHSLHRRRNPCVVDTFLTVLLNLNQPYPWTPFLSEQVYTFYIL